jgi:hypothetical protein
MLRWSKIPKEILKWPRPNGLFWSAARRPHDLIGIGRIWLDLSGSAGWHLSAETAKNVQNVAVKK